MTRFARAGPVNKKKEHEASSWQDLKNSRQKNNVETASNSTRNDCSHGKHKKEFSIRKDKKVNGISRERYFSKPGFSRKNDRRENRRLERAKQRKEAMVCYNCRGKGHCVADCPEVKEDIEQGTGICFKCGSTEHSSSSCKAKIAAGKYPYAKCFICGEKGHISKQCPDNPRGLYPLGGCCKECGSVEHLKKDCPDVLKEQGIDDTKLERMSNNMSADVETGLTNKNIKLPTKKKKQVKCVKF